MKKALLSSVAAIAAVSSFSAFAADLPSRKAAPVYAPPPPMWSGFYAGLNAGYGFGTSNRPVTSPYYGLGDPAAAIRSLGGADVISVAPTAFIGAPGANLNQSGFIGGGQLGYNYQWGSNFLVGLEADIQGTNMNGSGTIAGGAIADSIVGFGKAGKTIDNYTTVYNLNRSVVNTTSANAGVSWLGTVRGRLGYLVTPTLLVFGTGGLAYGDVYANVQNTGYGEITGTSDKKTGGKLATLAGSSIAVLSPLANYNNIQVGWTAGGGAEWMFMPNWSLKTEALYYDLGSVNLNSYSFGSTGPGTLSLLGGSTTRINYQGVIARAGVNYHFNWGAAPVVASY
jgi:outer membrane immunogenic protein